MSLIFIIAFALAPCLAIALFIYLKSTEEPEPLRVLIVGGVFGVIAFVLSIGITFLLEWGTSLDPGDVGHQVIHAFIFVGLVEESCKFLFLRGVLFRNKAFKTPFNGIVCAVMIGMGFATAENLVYVIGADTGAMVIRMFTAVPAHAAFAIIMGFFVGEAKVFPTSAGLYSGMGLLLAVFAHGFYDYFLFMSYAPGLWIQAMVSLVICVIIAHYALRRHRQDPTAETDY